VTKEQFDRAWNAVLKEFKRQALGSLDERYGVAMERLDRLYAAALAQQDLALAYQVQKELDAMIGKAEAREDQGGRND